jgi:hypothetical protein
VFEDIAEWRSCHAGRAWLAVYSRVRLVLFRTDQETCMIRVRSAFLMVSGVALLLAIVVTAWAGSKHGKPNPSDDGPFGGTAPSAEEFATYPKTLPPGAFADFTTTVPIGLAAGETLPSAALPSGVTGTNGQPAR